MGIRSRNALTLLTEIKLRLDRGNSLIYWFKNIFIGVAAVKVIFNIEDYWILGMLTLLAVIIVFVVGHMDLRYVKLMQKEQELMTGKYNPYFKRKLGRMR